MAMWIGLDGHEKLLDPPVEVLKKGGSSHDEYRPIDGRDRGFLEMKKIVWMRHSSTRSFLSFMFVVFYYDYCNGTYTLVQL